MRVSPLAVWGWRHQPSALIEIAHQEANLSHPHPACGAASAAFIVATAAAIRDGLTPLATWQVATSTATTVGETSVLEALVAAQHAAPFGADGPKMGWVLIALQNAFHQLLHAPSVEEGLARTIALGGDTDTNAAIAGALMGAVHGASALPARWIDRVLTCRPLDRPGIVRPRPRWCWPVDLLSVAERLVVLGRDAQSSPSRVGRATAAPTNGNSAG
jgi:ADP-ribosylglycohydrolase